MWTLLRGLRDWDEFRRDTTQSWRVDGIALNWGPGPSEFPAQAQALGFYDGRARVAFFYRADAVALMDAQPAEAGPDPLEAGATLSEYTRGVNAHLITIINELMRVAITTPERYGRDFAANLARVDRWTAEDRDRLARGVVCLRDDENSGEG